MALENQESASPVTYRISQMTALPRRSISIFSRRGDNDGNDERLRALYIPQSSGLLQHADTDLLNRELSVHRASSGNLGKRRIQKNSRNSYHGTKDRASSSQQSKLSVLEEEAVPTHTHQLVQQASTVADPTSCSISQPNDILMIRAPTPQRLTGKRRPGRLKINGATKSGVEDMRGDEFSSEGISISSINAAKHLSPKVSANLDHSSGTVSNQSQVTPTYSIDLALALPPDQFLQLSSDISDLLLGSGKAVAKPYMLTSSNASYSSGAIGSPKSQSTSSRRSSATSNDCLSRCGDEQSHQDSKVSPLFTSLVDSKTLYQGPKRTKPYMKSNLEKPLPNLPNPKEDHLSILTDSIAPPRLKLDKVKSVQQGHTLIDLSRQRKSLFARMHMKRAITIGAGKSHAIPDKSLRRTPCNLLNQINVRGLADAESIAQFGSGYLSYEQPWDLDKLWTTDSVPARVPPIPRKSRRREWQSLPTRSRPDWAQNGGLSRRHSDTVVALPALSLWDAKPTTLAGACRRGTDIPLGLTTKALDMSRQTIPSSDDKTGCTRNSTLLFHANDGLIVVSGPEAHAESPWQEYARKAFQGISTRPVLTILESLPRLVDLIHAARINRGMYTVYKANELDLVRKVCYNESPAAWEFHEWGFAFTDEGATLDTSTDSVHEAAKIYLSTHFNELMVIESLKKIIAEKCSSSLRDSTVAALVERGHADSQRFTDALWRLCSFCRIFGGEKGREDDIPGQVDWLKGGTSARSEACVATASAGMVFETGSVLLNPPEYFANGNADGLSDDDLFDMAEMWLSMASLLDGFSCLVNEARTAGVFNFRSSTQNSQETEAEILHEWICFVLTLGPAAVLNMAEFLDVYAPDGFAYANGCGWTNWSPLDYGGSRATFFSDAVSRLRQERTAQLSRSFLAGRHDKSGGNTPFQCAEDNPKVMRWSSVATKVPRKERKIDRIQSEGTDDSSSSRGSSNPSLDTPPSSFTTDSGPAWQYAHYPYDPVSAYEQSDFIDHCDTPFTESRSFSQKHVPLQYFGGVAEDTSELAIRAVMNMGFSRQEAAEALRVTDMGDGLRVDLAVDLLQRRD